MYVLFLVRIRVTIIDFRKVEQKDSKNEYKDKNLFLKRGQSRTEKFEKEDKIGQKNDYFIKCYQRLIYYIFTFEP